MAPRGPDAADSDARLRDTRHPRRHACAARRAGHVRGAHLPVGHVPRPTSTTTPTLIGFRSAPATPTPASRTRPRAPSPTPSPSWTAPRRASRSAPAWPPSMPPLAVARARRRPHRLHARRLRQHARACSTASSRASAWRSRSWTHRPRRGGGRADARARPALLYPETISNPTIVVADLAGLAELAPPARRHRRRRQHVRLALPLPAASSSAPTSSSSRPPSGWAATPTSSPASSPGARELDRGGPGRRDRHRRHRGALQRVPGAARHPDAARPHGPPLASRR